MSMPPIEIRWGGGKWPDAPKRRLRPYVSTALELAQLGLWECLGVRGNTPDTATVWCVADTDTVAGETERDNPGDMEVHIGYGYIKRPRKLPRVIAPLVTASAHELMHVFRLRSGHRLDLLEHAASEGVSMYAEGVVGVELGIGQVADYDIHMATLIGADVIESMRCRIIDDNERFVTLGGMEHEAPKDTLPELGLLTDDWFGYDDLGMGLPSGYLLGMHGVFSHLSRGVAFSNVAQMPAAQILGVE